MFGKEDFREWVKASHAIFKLFEWRFDAYPLTVKWVAEWLDSKSFEVEDSDKIQILKLLEDFDYEVYGVRGELKQRIDQQCKNLVEKHLSVGRYTNVGFAVAPYIFTWNFRRFKEYFKKDNFNVVHYFEKLGELLDRGKQNLQYLRNLKLMEDQVDAGRVRGIFNKINDGTSQIGINQNEPVGTTKILHVFAPCYFPLLDNSIARNTGLISYFGKDKRKNMWTKDSYLTGQPLSEYYLRWMEALKSWLQNYDILGGLEKEFQSSILKLVDEGLYVMCSLELRLRVDRLGLRVR